MPNRQHSKSPIDPVHQLVRCFNRSNGALRAWVLLLLPSLAACHSDEGAKQEPPHHTSPSSASSASSASSENVSSPAAAAPKTPAHDDSTRPRAENPASAIHPTQAIFNRVLIKFADDDVAKELADDGAWVRLIESKTGAKVQSVHRGPINTGVVVFAPLDPPRDEAAQVALANILSALPQFKYAEPDRLRGPR